METNKITENSAKPAVQQKTMADNVLAKVMEFQKNKSISLPENYAPENALRSAWLLLLDTKDKDNRPVLEICTKESIANAMLDMVLQGLNPVKKQCYFVPYGQKLTMMRSYHGTVALAKRIGGIKSVIANAIYEKDEFSFEVDAETGFKKVTKHVQTLESLDNTAVKGAYCIITLEDGTKCCEVMNMQQIHKSWEQGATKGKSPAHNNFSDEMAKKTVISRACKMYITTSDDADVYEEQDINDIRVIAVDEEISENANTKSIGFTEHSEVQEPVKEEATETQQSGPGF